MKLFIIGNGFDRSHKIPCLYSDFEGFLKDNAIRNGGLVGKLGDLYGRNAPELWSDFEGAIAYPDVEGFLRLCRVLPDVSIPDAIAGSLREEFGEWARRLDSEIDGTKAKAGAAFAKQDLFLNFNYTQTLELVYGIGSARVFHIHGMSTAITFALASRSDIIVGHGDGDRGILGQIEDRRSREQYLEFLKKTGKNVGENIREDRTGFFRRLKEERRQIDRAVTLGVSFSPIDGPYFEKIAEALGTETEWVLSYYSNKDRDNANAFAKRTKLAKYRVVAFDDAMSER